MGVVVYTVVHKINEAIERDRLRPRHPLYERLVYSLGARRRVGQNATNTKRQGRQPAHDDTTASLQQYRHTFIGSVV